MYPASLAPPNKHPRVCRMRNLLGPKPLEPFAPSPDFNWHVYYAAIEPEGRYVLVSGLAGTRGERGLLQAFDGGTGAPCRSRRWPSARAPRSGVIAPGMNGG
jgi:hypothetical protein